MTNNCGFSFHRRKGIQHWCENARGSRRKKNKQFRGHFATVKLETEREKEKKEKSDVLSLNDWNGRGTKDRNVRM